MSVDLESLESIVNIIAVICTLIGGLMITLIGFAWNISAKLSSTIQKNTDQLERFNDKVDELAEHVQKNDDACTSHRRAYDKTLTEHKVLLNDHGRELTSHGEQIAILKQATT